MTMVQKVSYVQNPPDLHTPGPLRWEGLEITILPVASTQSVLKTCIALGWIELHVLLITQDLLLTCNGHL